MLGIVAYAYTLNTWEVEEGGSGVQDQPSYRET